MAFERPQMTTVETQELRQILDALNATEVERAKAIVKHILGLDREVTHAQD